MIWMILIGWVAFLIGVVVGAMWEHALSSNAPEKASSEQTEPIPARAATIPGGSMATDPARRILEDLAVDFAEPTPGRFVVARTPALTPAAMMIINLARGRLWEARDLVAEGAIELIAIPR